MPVCAELNQRDEKGSLCSDVLIKANSMKACRKKVRAGLKVEPCQSFTTLALL